MKRNTQYCQKCQSLNSIDEPNCLKCGTRLMIVTFPTAYRRDEPSEPSYYEQFLLEKISSLELQVVQMVESMNKIIAIFEKSTKIFDADHKTIEKIVSLFEKITSENALPLWAENTSNQSDKLDKFKKQIISQHDGRKPELFDQLIKDGFKFYLQNEEKQTLRTFEQAVAISPKNVVLLTFLGTILFEQENLFLAERYLKKAHEIVPNDEKVLVLLATVYTELERFDDAKNCIDFLPNDKESMLCVNFINGFVFYAKEDWSDSLRAFQECMSILPCAETAYLFGCILYQVKQDELAKTVLEMAVRFDENFADAWFMLSQTCLSNGSESESKKYLKKASDVKDSRSQCFEFLTGKKEMPKIALPFIKNKFFLKGSKRLSELFRSELEKILNS